MSFLSHTRRRAQAPPQQFKTLFLLFIPFVEIVFLWISLFPVFYKDLTRLFRYPSIPPRPNEQFLESETPLQLFPLICLENLRIVNPPGQPFFPFPRPRLVDSVCFSPSTDVHTSLDLLTPRIVKSFLSIPPHLRPPKRLA